MKSETIWIEKWRTGNNEGRGFAIGNEDDTPRQSVADADAHIIEEDEVGNILVDYEGSLLVVCDANGPWAVAID